MKEAAIQRATLVFCIEPQRILLGMKKRGFGEGKWNGMGGKLLPTETLEECSRREMEEEAGIQIGELKKCGILRFEYQDSPPTWEVHVFKSSDFNGTICESDEMCPRWFALDEIPYESMWLDDKYWLPLLLKGQNFLGKFLFQGHEKILDHRVEIVPQDQNVPKEWPNMQNRQ